MSTAFQFAPLAAAQGTPIQLAMQRLWLTGQVLPAGARLVVQHVFRSAEARPLEVIYAFPLPRDAALRGFRITGDAFDVRSELKPREEAVREYEKGIAEGSLAALAQAYGDGVVNLTVGNIRPNETVTVSLEILAGVESHDDGYRFRFPFTLAPSYHPKMRAAVVDGEGELELPASFGDVILPRFRKVASDLHEVGFDLLLPGGTAEEIASPSHAIRLRQGATPRVQLAPERDVPDRDLVLDVRYAGSEARVFAGPRGDGARPFAAVMPSTVFGQPVEAPRKVAILLDRSGSMDGAPITQAKKAIEACLAALSADDQFALVAFDDRVEKMDSVLLHGTKGNRERARAFLAGVDARGGTELAAGFEAAASLLAGSGDVMVLTDGQVFGTEQILARARAAGVRIFALGIGSASQDRFLSLLARETQGVSRFVTPRERVDLAAVDLFASAGRPVAAGLRTPESVRPSLPDAVFAGTPVVAFGSATGAVAFEWSGGRLDLPIPDGDAATGETVRLLQGSRLITDAETRYGVEAGAGALGQRQQGRVATMLRTLSEEFGLASREMSLVAVVRRAADRPGELPETRVVPVGMPQDVRFESTFAPGSMQFASAPQPASFMTPVNFTAGSAAPPRASGSVLGKMFSRRVKRMTSGDAAPPPPAQDETAEDALLALAAELEPDGGMPGANQPARVARTIAALLAFIAGGHTATAGAFRSHVARLVRYLELAQGLGEEQQALAAKAVACATAGNCPAGDWLATARSGDWTAIRSSLG
jgi:Ca-activated chloride channel family protein